MKKMGKNLKKKCDLWKLHFLPQTALENKFANK